MGRRLTLNEPEDLPVKTIRSFREKSKEFGVEFVLYPSFVFPFGLPYLLISKKLKGNEW